MFLKKKKVSYMNTQPSALFLVGAASVNWLRRDSYMVVHQMSNLISSFTLEQVHQDEYGNK